MNEPIMYHLMRLAHGKFFKNVLNVGSADTHKGKFPNPKEFFKCGKYIGIDIVEGDYVDRTMNVKKLRFPNYHFDCIICTETLEHIDDIYKATSEMKRVLADDGIMFISVPFQHAFHEYPEDYWRMTPSALDFLFKGLKREELYLIAGDENPRTIIAIYRKVRTSDLKEKK